MTKPTSGAVLTTLSLGGPAEGLPLHRQLYLRIRELILDGGLGRGTRLPSSRTLARELSLSRNTVVSAVDQLVAEGYVVSRVGDGTYVSEVVPEDDARPLGARRDGASGRATVLGVSERGRRFLSSAVATASTEARPFTLGLPALDAFPFDRWHRLEARRRRRIEAEGMAYGVPGGHAPLREAIAGYVAAARGVRCEPEQVLVVSSTQQAIDLASRVLLDSGDPVWMEEPGYLGARSALLGAGAKITPVPVDGEGLDVEAGIALEPAARLAVVTPSHQFPTGATLSLERRLALLDWASATGAWIVEDDYDSEYRYAGRPLAALQGLDPQGQVLYLGTFSKVLFPALRLGYMVVPEGLVEPMMAAKAAVDRNPATGPQMVVTDFMEGGHFGSHLRRMRKLYRHRQQTLLCTLEELCGDGLRARPDDAGMHLVADLPDAAIERRIVEHCQAAGVQVSPLSGFYLGERRRHGLLLGYACVNDAQIRRGVEAIAAVL